MKHRVLMLGGRRSGKSSILSSVLYSLQQTQGEVKNKTNFDCAITDTTDYEHQFIETPRGTEKLPELREKRLETHSYILRHRDMGNKIFTVDMTPTYGKGTYSINVTINAEAQINFDFVDVPGEWMKAGENGMLKEEIKKSDVFIIAIDTPFLMQQSEDPSEQEINENVNLIYNRLDEIVDALEHLQFGGADENAKNGADEDKKLILLCPVKCEKWALSGLSEEVTERVKIAYDRLLTRWVADPRVDIRIMPIQTAGGLESARMLPASLLYRSDDQEKGESCSVDPNTGMIILADGLTIRPKEQYQIMADGKAKIDHFDIPLSWYRVNGRSFKPMYCEQPAYNIIEFLLNKEENVIKTKACIEQGKLREMNWFSRWIKIIFNPTFGQYLPKFRDFVNALKNSGLIKYEGDGFEVVKARSNRVIHG